MAYTLIGCGLDTDLSALKAVRRAPDREWERPLAQTHAADPEVVLYALAGYGNKTVERH